jgi:hypothetical protein
MIFSLKTRRKTSPKPLLRLAIYIKANFFLRKNNNNILIFKRNYINVINKDNVFVNNTHKDIIYLILSINAIKTLKAKGRRLQIA